jgi:hypothetical protein
MIDPSWKRLTTVRVAAKPEGLWNLILPYVSGPRLLRLSVVGKHRKSVKVSKQWRLNSDEVCSADGLLNNRTKRGQTATACKRIPEPGKHATEDPKQCENAPRASEPPEIHKEEPRPLLPTAARGTLVGKIGGSTADLPDLSSTGASTLPAKKFFVSGSFALVELANTDCGPLFLTMNDSPELFCQHSGELWVRIDEGLA